MLMCISVAKDHRSSRTGFKFILVIQSVQDLKIAISTSKDLFFGLGAIHQNSIMQKQTIREPILHFPGRSGPVWLSSAR